MIAAAIAAAVFACTPTRVWDGDGPIWCAEGPKVRLAGIAARELDGTCRPYHPCPAASGIAARDAAVRLLGGPRGRSAQGHVLVRSPTLRCRSYGDGKYGREAAACVTPAGVDLGCALVRAGVAASWPRRDGPPPCRPAAGNAR